MRFISIGLDIVTSNVRYLSQVCNIILFHITILIYPRYAHMFCVRSFVTYLFFHRTRKMCVHALNVRKLVAMVPYINALKFDALVKFKYTSSIVY